MAILLKKLSFDTATQTRNTERAFPFREGSFAAQASFFNDMFWPKLFEKNKIKTVPRFCGHAIMVLQVSR